MLGQLRVAAQLIRVHAQARDPTSLIALRVVGDPGGADVEDGDVLVAGGRKYL